MPAAAAWSAGKAAEGQKEAIATAAAGRIGDEGRAVAPVVPAAKERKVEGMVVSALAIAMAAWALALAALGIEAAVAFEATFFFATEGLVRV